MASRNILHATDATILIERLEDLDRLARDKLANAIALRFVGAERGKKHTCTQVRPTAFPVWVGGKRCTVAVHAHYVMSRPREHVTEMRWYPTAVVACQAHPDARIQACPGGKPPLD